MGFFHKPPRLHHQPPTAKPPGRNSLPSLLDLPKKPAIFKGTLTWFVPHCVRLLVIAEDLPNASTLMEEMFVGGRPGGGWFDVVSRLGSGWLGALACWLLWLVRLRLLSGQRVHHIVLQPLRDQLWLVMLEPLLVPVLQPVLQLLLRRCVQLL